MKNLAGYLVHLLGRRQSLSQVYLSPHRDRCLACGENISEEELYSNWRVCPYCRFHYTLTARERIEILVDQGSFKETRRDLVSLDPLSFSTGSNYRKNITQDQKRTGLTDAAVTGQATLGGHKVKIVVLDFGFMGGSMGSVVGEKLALAFEAAAKQKRPVVAVITGGGVRVQEGILSLMQMAKTVTAAKRLSEKKLPFITVLANPATGQAYSSFANIADIIIAEPGSLIGMVPLKTLREASEFPLPFNAHTAEAHLERGLLDIVVDREDIGECIARILTILDSEDISFDKKMVKNIKIEVSSEPEPWQAVELARNEARPSTRYYIDSVFDNFIELRGDRVSSDDRTITGGLGLLAGKPIMVIGQERDRKGSLSNSVNGASHIFPEGFRKAQRLMILAAKFKLPVVTLVDTDGAHPGLDSEEQGIGNSIATTLSLMAELPVPVVSAITGEAGSEGALALGVADSILMQQFAIYSPLSPEKMAIKIYRDKSKVKEAAESLKLTASGCKELGIVDTIVPEPDEGAHVDPLQAAHRLRDALIKELARLSDKPVKKLLKERYKKFRNMGEFSTYFKEAVQREVASLQRVVLRAPKRSQR
ncbi:acetyl-CoA carboxylase carboxyl transferase subunit beta [SAR202 cluster bacterium AD-804-J14_MRT_500m]|nr:acetyl-CoA carboxylase carboxyl transferase subunit beta [SAR202 cluster bacterium AD-804-J14_MRT_500m]